MKGANGNALEWALALLQAPEQRHLLKQRPLPSGVTELLGIAAGVMPEALADAVQRFAEPAAKISEAARFYAREVLFYPQADAYRILGVLAHADAEQIKTHHRLLQAWLHPDRLRSDDDAVFAARVNHAWNQLRTPGRRQAYDETLQRSEHLDTQLPRYGKQAWRPQEHGAVPAWRRRLPVLALLAVCAVLLLLSVYDLLQRPAGQMEHSAQASAEAVAGLAAFRLKTAQESEAEQTDGHESSMEVIAAVRKKLGVKPAEPAQRSVMPLPAPALAVERVGVESECAVVKPYVAKGEEIKAEPVVNALEAPSAPQAAAVAVTRTPDLQQVSLAQQAGGQLLDYLQTPKRLSPPIWNNPAVQNRADRLRGEWHASGNVRMQPAQWRIGAETAELTAGYAMRKSAAERGRLVATLRWRDGTWLVTDLNLEPLQ